MKRFIGTVKRTSKATTQTLSRDPAAAYPTDSPESTVIREVDAFCETGETERPGDEYLHLPAIVEAAESSPTAARAAAQEIHKFLSKPNTSRGIRQYNSIMLIRILTDNPGPIFTRNFDARFVASVKGLLRDGRDMSVQQILRETLESFAQTKATDGNLAPLIEMWTREKEKFEKHYNLSPLPGAAQTGGQDYFVRQHRNRGIPPQKELAARVSEANSSAQLLLQMVQSTPLSEFQQNEMLKEFAGRCQSASKSMQSYINSTDPAPDEDTMLTLIETNEKLSVSLSKYQRATLNARRQYGSPQPPAARTPQQAPPIPDSDADANAPSTGATANKSSSKGGLLRGLSLRRKPTFKREPVEAVRRTESNDPPNSTMSSAQPPQQANQPASTSRDVSPIGGVGPSLFPSPPGEQKSTSTNDEAARSTAAPYQYNSDDFQIENPFADKFSTTNKDAAKKTQNGSASAEGGSLGLNFQTHEAGSATKNGVPPANDKAG